MKALLKKERILQAVWHETEGSNMKNHVHGILLAAQVRGSDINTGYLLLSYRFSNYGDCENEIQASEAEVL
jgi:hypothetical protein